MTFTYHLMKEDSMKKYILSLAIVLFSSTLWSVENNFQTMEASGVIDYFKSRDKKENDFF
jgi:hypothetical protein